MNIVVQKFGGSSISTVEKINNVCNHIIREYNKNNKVIVVVSAQGKTTNKLIEEEKEITLKANKREHDMLLSVGEQISIAKLTMMLQEKGYDAISFTGWQIPIITNNNYSNARIEDIDEKKILKELDKNKIVVIAGFQGVTKDGQITTLGRGGSDTTAVAIAVKVNANRCDIYTDVDGIYSADPKIIKNITKINSISYDEILELSSLGAKVLHNRCVELGKNYNMPLFVKSSFKNSKGTSIVNNTNKVKRINNDFKLEHVNIKGIAIQKNVVKVIYILNKNDINVSYKLFDYITKSNIVLDMILQNNINDDNNILSFIINENDLDEVLNILNKNKKIFYIENIENSIRVEKKLSKISIVGNGIMSNTYVLEQIYNVLESENIKFHSIVTSEMKISILLREEEADIFMKAIHKVFFENNKK